MQLFVRRRRQVASEPTKVINVLVTDFAYDAAVDARSVAVAPPPSERDGSFALQFATPALAAQWFAALSEAHGRALNDNFEQHQLGSSLTPVRAASARADHAWKATLQRAAAAAGNSQCADCSAPIDFKTAWAVINIGVFVCAD